MSNGLLVKRRTTGNSGSGQVESPAQDAGEAPAPMIPFTRASRIKSQQAYSGTFTVGSSAQQLAPMDVPAGGLVKFLDFDFVMTTAGNSAATAYNADGPFSVVQSISVTNAAGNSIYVPITGYQWYLTNKYMAPGVDPSFIDPKADPYYSATTGSGGGAIGGGATGGGGAGSLDLDPPEV